MFKKFLSLMSIGLISSASMMSVISCGADINDKTPWHKTFTYEEEKKFNDSFTTETIKVDWEKTNLESFFNYKKDGTYANMIWNKINTKFINDYNYKENNNDEYTIADGIKNSLIENFDLNWSWLYIPTIEGFDFIKIDKSQWGDKVSSVLPKNINYNQLGVEINKTDSEHFTWSEHFNGSSIGVLTIIDKK